MVNCSISVIVPIYNVEKYIQKCVKSILNQTFKDFEIILVNDGSTDDSGNICEKLYVGYENIKIYHKPNGGLSDARNYGVRKSNGKYITFIDSDDYVRCDYLELLYNALIEKNSDISVVLPQIVYENTDFSISLNKVKNSKIEVMTGKELLKYSLLGEKGSLSAWGKLYKKEYTEKYPFPFGQLYEDMEVIYNMYLNSDRITFIDEKLYFYLHRENSIVHSKVTEKHLYGIKSCISMLKSNNERNLGLEEYIMRRIVMQACGHLPNLVRYKDKDMFNEISKLVKVYIKNILWKNNISIKLKIRAQTYLFNAHVGLFYADIFLSAKIALYSTIRLFSEIIFRIRRKYGL